jgi:L-fucose mutarotase
LCLVDANFPAKSVAGSRPIIRLDGIPITRATEAILSVLPLDIFVPHPILCIEVVGDPDALPQVQSEVSKIASLKHGSQVRLGLLERLAFYQAARSAFAVVVTANCVSTAVS